MSHDPFEAELEAMFATVSEAPDADAFSAAVERRLARQARVRSLVVAITGLAGAVVALPRIAGLAGEVRHAAAGGLGQANAAVNTGLVQGAGLMHAIPMGQAGLWMALGLAGLMAVGLARVLREI